MRKITGTLVWYYYVCPREVWLMAQEIHAFQEDPFLEIGRIIHEKSYKREKKEVEIEGMKFDLIKSDRGFGLRDSGVKNVLIAEVKKSSRFLKASIMQLCFYLFNLEKMGINAEGELRIPKEKKKIKVRLDDEKREELKKAFEEIKDILQREKPPSAERIKFCKNCAYREFCWT